jgi:hypothetical protein
VFKFRLFIDVIIPDITLNSLFYNRLEIISGICHGMAERLPALCLQATALDRIALVLADKYRHLAGTESIRLIYPHDSDLSCTTISLLLIYSNIIFSFNLNPILSLKSDSSRLK